MPETIFVGLPGPYHNYGGLAYGNIASESNCGKASYPKLAAKQVLELVKLLLKLGQHVAILPPQQRPDFEFLKARGYDGTSAEIIKRLAENEPELLPVVYSSSAMWAANAATVTPNIDCEDRKLHLTPANLITNLHRSIETKYTYKALCRIFKGEDFYVHSPLHDQFPDEGAANHMRLSKSHDSRGLHIFVYGKDGGEQCQESESYPARQSLEAFKTITEQHKIPPEQVMFVKQNRNTINQGVFHNDVIAVSNENLMIYHEAAYENSVKTVAEIKRRYQQINKDDNLHLIKITNDELSVDEAIRTYFFNSQIITIAPGRMVIIAPTEAEENHKTAMLIEKIIADKSNPVTQIHYVNLRQSMQNGGGPACLRLRVVMTPEQIDNVKHNANLFIDSNILAKIEDIVEKHYPEKLVPEDLKKPLITGDSCIQLQNLCYSARP